MNHDSELYELWGEVGNTEHVWIEDKSFKAEEDSTCIERHECLFCDAELYKWIGLKNKAIQTFSYILVGSTQYAPDSYKCPKKY